MQLLAGTVVVTFAFFLLGLAGTSFVRPSVAGQFLLAFASSARAHYLEQALRLAVGGSLIAFSASMWHPGLFRVAGWVLIGTSLGLLCIPWRWPARFARWVVPPVVRHVKLYGLGAALLGGLALGSVLAGAG